MFWSHEATLLRDKHSLLRDKHSLLRDKQSLFCDKKVCFVTNTVYFVTNKVCFCDKQSLLRDKQSLLCDKQTLLRGKATFLSYEEALLGRRNTYKHQPLNKRRTYHGHKHIRVRVSFTHESDHQIEETTGAVITGGTTFWRTASKFLRDWSSFQVVLPGESSWRRIAFGALPSPAPSAWQA